MGIVYHSNYLIWMEVGRVELCRSLGVTYRDMEREGVLLTVAEVNCRFHGAARYDDEVIVNTRLGHVHPRMVTFEYEMRRVDDGLRLVSGHTKHVICGPDLKPARMPQKYRPMFGMNER
ncbi:MAG: acyl-CoA thioesterase [Candidatus Solibacter usitatus]|nr:acyl-CoA thioesterase [Candidatus Solibacter usitatus]